MRRPLLALLLAAGLVAGLAGANGQAPDSCRAEFAAAVDAVVALERSETGDYDALLRRIQRLQTRHADGPAECRSDMAVEVITLVNYLDRTDEAIRLADAYLASDLADDFPVHRAFVLRVRGYAREALGRTVDGAQDYFAAGAIAHRLPFGHALLALGDAAETALAMGDLAGATRFSAAAERVARDSTHIAVSIRHLALGRLLAARTAVLVRQMEAAPEGPARRRFAAVLRATADSAQTNLDAGRDAGNDPRLDDASAALAWSARALADAALGDEPAARRALQASAGRLAASSSSSRDAGHTVWMRAVEVHRMLGDAAAGRVAALRARDEARRSGVLAAEAAAIEAMGFLAEAAGDSEAAEAHYREALTLREVERERLELQDWSVPAFAASQASYRGLARVLARQGRAREALAALDQSRARHLRDLRAQVALRERLDTPARQRVDSLLTAIEEQRLIQLRDVDVTGDVALRISRLQSELRAATDVDQTSPSLDVDALQQALRDGGRTMVSYLVDREASFAFVVTPDTVAVRPLPTTEAGVERLLVEARGPWGSSPDAALVLAPLHALHRVLVAPVADLIGTSSPLVVIPDGALADLPFGLLTDAPSDDYERAPYLVRRRPVATELAAALLTEPALPSPPPAVDLVAFGRSRFGVGAGRARGVVTGGALPDLPFVADEIERVTAYARRRVVALDARATETSLMERIREGRIVHIASHAEAATAFPMHSQIHLWPGGDDDGVVHLYEFQGRRVAADLVVLSGCATAGGAVARGEGTLGLHYGLRAAGARATLATLWPVDDRATADVMDAFYAALADGLPKDRALQRAQLAYLDAHEGLAASPFYWASFVLSGDPASVPMTPPRRVPPAAWMAGLLAVGGLAWAAASRRRRARRSVPSL